MCLGPGSQLDFLDHRCKLRFLPKYWDPNICRDGGVMSSIDMMQAFYDDVISTTASGESADREAFYTFSCYQILYIIIPLCWGGLWLLKIEQTPSEGFPTPWSFGDSCPISLSFSHSCICFGSAFVPKTKLYLNIKQYIQ